jgi:hypothetical protein
MSQFASMKARNKFALFSILKQLDDLILSTPTGELRCALTGAHIHLLLADKLPE